MTMTSKEKLKIITKTENEEWNKIVKSFKDYDVYYLSEYTKGFANHGDGEPLLFYYEDHNMKAMNVVMKRDICLDERFVGKISSNTFFDISTPYGYGGFLLEGNVVENSLEKLNTEYSELCREIGIISEFVRFHPVIGNSKYLKKQYDQSKLGKTISVDLQSLDQMWDDMSSRNRGKIRKATKSGVNVYWGRDDSLYEKFINLYNVTMDHNEAKNYYYFEEEYYQSILNDMKYNSLLFYAVYEETIVSMAIILFSNTQMHYHLSGSDKQYRNLYPSNLLLYEVAKWGSENGYKTFHLGGGLGGNEDSLFNFKKIYNKNPTTSFTIGRKIFCEEKYEYLNSLRRENTDQLDSNTFFPKYRS